MRNNKRGISLLQQEETNAAEDANDNNIKQGQQTMRSSTRQLLELLDDENAKVTATAGFRPRRIAKNKI